MIKGSQKQMIVLRTSSSRYFDEAYFVLRREVSHRRGSNTDLLREAERILDENGMSARRPPKRSRSVIWFFSGLFLGGGATALLLLLL